ncbi:MAG: Fe-S-cluster containining protein [Candidatus Paceibacteria bacterium]|jgi:Fe-S-cluster containining protein
MPKEPWYQAGLRFECQRTGNCCRTHGEYAFVYLSEADVTAISGHLGLSEEEFLEQRCAQEGDYTILRIDEPACPFLSPESTCNIYSVRPKQCATWPFWDENLKDEKRWEGPVKQCCPGIGKGRLHSVEEIEQTARETEEWYE